MPGAEKSRVDGLALGPHQLWCESIHAETDEGLGTRSDRQEYGGAAREPPGLRVQGRARLGAAGSECVLQRVQALAERSGLATHACIRHARGVVGVERARRVGAVDRGVAPGARALGERAHPHVGWTE